MRLARLRPVPPLAAGVSPTIPAYAEASSGSSPPKDRAPIRRRQLDGRRDRARAGAPRGACDSHGDLAGGLLDAGAAALLPGVALSLARTPRAAPPALEALIRTRAGRTALLWQTFGSPTLLLADEAVATLRDAWAAPAFASALAAFDDYVFAAGEQLSGTPLTVLWGRQDRLLPYRRRPARTAMLPQARHVTLGAGHVPFYDDPPAVAEAIRAGAG